MAITNTKFLGRNFTLLVETSTGVFTAVGGMRTTGCTINNEVIDITDKDDDTWKKLLPGGIRTISLSGSGLVSNALAYEKAQDVCDTGTTINAKVVLEGGMSVSAPFLVTSLEQHGDYNGAQMFSCTLQSMNTPNIGVATTATLEFNFFDSGSINPTTGAATMTFTRSTTAVYRDTDGYLKTAAINAARMEFDSAGNRLGYLPEPQATNLLLQSQTFQTTWTQTAATIVADQAQAPDGTLSGDLLRENSASAVHNVTQSASKAASAIQYSGSIFIRAAGRTQVWMLLSDGTTSCEAFFNLSTGAVTGLAGAWTGLSAVTEPYRDGWWRVSITATSPATTTVSMLVALSIAGNPTYTGDGSSGVYLWGAQLEAQPQATSYIATTTAQVTRTADVLTATSITGISTTVGAIAIEFVEAASSVGAAAVFCAFNDNTTSDRILAYRNTSLGVDTVVVSDNGVTQASFGDAAAPSLGTINKIAAAFAVNDFAASFLGGAVQVDSSGTMFTANQLQIGHEVSGTQPGRPIRKVAYYNTRLVNSDLVALTS